MIGIITEHDKIVCLQTLWQYHIKVQAQISMVACLPNCLYVQCYINISTIVYTKVLWCSQISELYHDSLYMSGTPRLLKLLWYYHVTKYKNKIIPCYFVSEGASGMYWNSPAAGFSVRSRLWVRVTFGSAAGRAEARRTENRRG